MARFYDVNGKLYESVTTALNIIRKPFLEQWRGKLGNEEADIILHEAGDLGSEVHSLCEQIIRGEKWDTGSEQAWCMASAYEKWFSENIKSVLHVERATANDLYRYAGRVDLIARLKYDRTYSVIDYKTGNALYKDVPLQLSAYKEALLTEGIKTKRRLALHINKKELGKITAKEYDEADHEKDYRMFLYALELYRYFNAGAKPREIVKLRREIA